jgi:hypothetical protein
MENYENNDLLLIFKLSNFINQMTKELSNVQLILVLPANKNFYVKFVAPFYMSQPTPSPVLSNLVAISHKWRK